MISGMLEVFLLTSEVDQLPDNQMDQRESCGMVLSPLGASVSLS